MWRPGVVRVSKRSKSSLCTRSHGRPTWLASQRRVGPSLSWNVRQTRARLLPSVTGSGRYTWYTDPRTTSVVLPPGALPAGATPPDVVIRADQEGTLNGTLTVPIDVWGEASRALVAAQAGYRGERARAWATRLGEEVGVIRAYFDLLEAEGLRYGCSPMSG